MEKTKPQIYQLDAFVRGVKPGVYEVWKGHFEDDKFINEEPRKGWRWRRYFRKFNQILRDYNYIHVSSETHGVTYQRF